jgi:hypothetical protein
MQMLRETNKKKETERFKSDLIVKALAQTQCIVIQKQT